MPSLSPDTGRELRKRLDAARRDIIDHIRSRNTGDEGPPPVAPAAHLGQPDDMAQASYIGDNEMAQLGHEQAVLRDIDSALARLAEGVANVCTMCGEDIPEERLLSMPTAHTCVECQQRMEADESTPRAPSM